MNPPLEPDLADETIARSVLSLQREAYAVEAALIGSTGIPALTETLEARRAAGETWLGIRADDGLAGAVSWRELADGTVDIPRLVFAPRAFGAHPRFGRKRCVRAPHPGHRATTGEPSGSTDAATNVGGRPRRMPVADSRQARHP